MSSSPSETSASDVSPAGARSDTSSTTDANIKANGSTRYKAVIFDMGGVLVKYQHPEVFKSLAKNASNNVEFKQDLVAYERGAASFADIQQHMKSIPQLAHLHDLDGPGLFDQFMGDHDTLIQKAIDALKTHGYKVGLCTNNGFLDAERTKSAIICDTSRFDAVVESCRVGVRKPNHGIYQITAERLGVRCDECIFIDDLAVNCEGAEEVGMKAIHLADENSQAAVDQLEKLLGVSLL